MSEIHRLEPSEEVELRSAELRVLVAAAAQQHYEGDLPGWEQVEVAWRRHQRQQGMYRAVGFAAAAMSLTAAVGLSLVLWPRSPEPAFGSPEPAGAPTLVASASIGGERALGDDTGTRVDVDTEADGGATPTASGKSLLTAGVQTAAIAAGRSFAEVADGGLATVLARSSAGLAGFVATLTGDRDVVTVQVSSARRASSSSANGAASDEAERLSVAAEAALSRGDRTVAIRTLDKLLRVYPRSRQARAALLDVARLRSASGDREGAACAYRYFLQKYPQDAVRGDVARRLSTIGEVDARCRGSSRYNR